MNAFISAHLKPVRISRDLGIDFTRCWAGISRHLGQPFHCLGQSGRQVS